MSKILYFFFGLLFLPILSEAQVKVDNYPVKIVSTNFTKKGIERSEEDVQLYKGSPFLSQEFKNGQVIDTYGTSQNLDMRFNVYNNEVEMLNDKKVAFTLQKLGNIDKVIIGRDTLVLDFCSENKRLNRKYFLLLYSGKTKIYDLPFVYAKVEPVLIDGKTVDIPIFTSIYSKYFLKTGAREARAIKDKKSFLRILGNKRTEMEQYIKNCDFNINRKEDIIKAITYYDGL